MNPKISETIGKFTITTLLGVLGFAAKKFGPEVSEKAKEAIPVIIKKVLRRG